MAALLLEGDAWYERLRAAESLTIELLDSDLTPVTFDLTRFFSTPLQDEIDDCVKSDSDGRRWSR